MLFSKTLRSRERVRFGFSVKIITFLLRERRCIKESKRFESGERSKIQILIPRSFVRVFRYRWMAREVEGRRKGGMPFPVPVPMPAPAKSPKVDTLASLPTRGIQIFLADIFGYVFVFSSKVLNYRSTRLASQANGHPSVSILDRLPL